VVSAAGTTDLDPVAERLIADARARDCEHLVGRERLTRWLSAAVFLACAGALAFAAPTSRAPNPALVAALIVGYALASRVQFEVGSGLTAPTQLVFVPMLFVLPAREIPIAVAVGLTVGAVPDYLRGRAPAERAIVLIGNATYALAPALVLLVFGEPRADATLAWLAVAAALLAQFALDFSSSTVREWCALRVHPRELVQPLLWVLAVDAALTPVGMAAATAASVTSAAALLPLPLLGLIWVFARERERRLDNMLELSSAYRGTALLLGDVIEADDAYTGSHSRDVVELVLAVCDRLGVDARSRRNAELAALLHDVGKIKIPAEIINKPGPLTPDERKIVNTHTIEGERLLRRVGGLLADVGGIVRSCHERYDGGGYPDGLAGEEIPLVARVVACCDAYNAMTTDRPYRRALSTEAAVAELIANRGTQFDPTIADVLLALLPAQ